MTDQFKRDALKIILFQVVYAVVVLAAALAGISLYMVTHDEPT